ncbi:hypothetical protein [Citrobacter sp. CRE-46]|uniref:hypothetical protein n=1 Tax=Citrobacter sp. CRE-46 TaxID=1703250 RepID=UPI000D7C7E56|nr:hypothetical protein [Citrobacter sp. CRE-46]AWS97533.1 hypothetical protein AN232_21135 [Citrobacter sp. CRE-46]AWS97584.1 hypothetical protein AN232_21430 [Citrobacter sp. CRE-46]
MTALNKQALRMRNYLDTALKSGVKLLHLSTDELKGLLDELEAADKRIAELQIARDKCFLSGLKTGWEYGIADDTEGYNREIADAQAVIYRAAGIGVKGE